MHGARYVRQIANLDACWRPLRGSVGRPWDAGAWWQGPGGAWQSQGERASAAMAPEATLFLG